MKALFAVCFACLLVACGASSEPVDTLAADASEATGGESALGTGGGSSFATGGAVELTTGGSAPSATGGASTAATGGQGQGTGGSAPISTGGTSAATGGTSSTAVAPSCALYALTPTGMGSKIYQCVCGSKLAALTPPAFPAGCTVATASAGAVSWGTCAASLANCFSNGAPAVGVNGGYSALVYGFDTLANCSLGQSKLQG